MGQRFCLWGVSRLQRSRGINALIKLKVTDHSPWCTANLESELVPTPLTTGLTQSSVFINLNLRDDAPAYGEGYVKISASVSKMGLIGGFEKEFTLDFVPEYLPRIDVNLPEGHYQKHWSDGFCCYSY